MISNNNIETNSARKIKIYSRGPLCIRFLIELITGRSLCVLISLLNCSSRFLLQFCGDRFLPLCFSYASQSILSIFTLQPNPPLSSISRIVSLPSIFLKIHCLGWTCPRTSSRSLKRSPGMMDFSIDFFLSCASNLFTVLPPCPTSIMPYVVTFAREMVAKQGGSPLN